MINGYKPQYASCRDVGHKWDYWFWNDQERLLVCANCPTKRKDYLTPSGKINSRQYFYPKDYHVKHTPKLVLELRRHLRREARKLARWVGPGKKRHLTLVKKRA